jgi:uncharacterized protein with LGFP repeats
MDPGDPARDAREIKAEHSSTVVHAGRDIRGDITIVHDQRGHELGMFNRYIEADLLTAMPHEEAAKSIALSSVAASAPVLKALLSTESDRGLAISLLATITQRQAEELLAAIGSPEADELVDLPAAAAAMAECAARLRSDLGNACGRMERAGTSERGTEGFWREFERGGIHWSASSGPQATIGPIALHHDDAGGSRLQLGFPVAPQNEVQGYFPETTGRYQRFEGATVYSSDTHGVHDTWGPIGELYEREHGPAGRLGFPVSAEAKAGPSVRDTGKRTTGLCQRFEGGTVYFSDKTGTVAVPGPIADHHEGHHRGAAGYLGFPVSPMLKAKPSPPPWKTAGNFQRFEGRWDYDHDKILKHWRDDEGPGGATIYTCEAYGTHCVGWGNGTLYEQMGGTGSWLGFPMSDEIKHRPSAGPGYTVQEFEGGVIIWSKAHGSVSVPRATMEYLDQRANLREQLGLPLPRSPESTADEPVQFFENGVVTTRDAMPEGYLRTANPPEAGPQRIRLAALTFSPETVTPGEPVFLDYEVQALPDPPSPVVLGATLLSENGDEYFDKAGDLRVDVTPGRASYRRPLVVPASATLGRYRLIGAIWHPSIGAQRLGRIDRGFVVTVTDG